MAVPHHITIDLKQDWDSPYKIPRVTQNDTDIEFIITVKDGGREINVSEQYSTVTMTSQRPDRKAFYVLGKPNAETGKVHFTLGSKEVEMMGRVAASIQLYSVDGRQSTAHFAYRVRGDLSTQMVPTEKESTLIEQVLVDGPRIISEAEQAALDSIASLDDFNQEKAAALAELAEIKDSNRVIFRQPVNTFADLATTYPNPEHGTTVRVTSEAASYRYSDGTWVKTDEYNPTAIDQVTAQLAEKPSQEQLNDIAISVKLFGATGDGITDDTNAIQGAIDSVAVTGGEIIVPRGTYNISGEGINIPDKVSFVMHSSAKLIYDGNGTAITVFRSWRCKYVFQVERKTLSWLTDDSTSVGVLLDGVDYCDITIIRVAKFHTGVIVGGLGNGCCFNTIYNQNIEDNRVGIDFKRTTVNGLVGWCNSNSVSGGNIRINGSYASNDTKLINLDGNNNVFFNVALESGAHEFTIYCVNSFNMFLNCRFEQNRPGSVYFSANATFNAIIGGYGVLDFSDPKITDLGKSNMVMTPRGLNIQASDNVALRLSNGFTNSLPVWEVRGTNGNVYSRQMGSGNLEFFDSSGDDGTKFPAMRLNAVNSTFDTGTTVNDASPTPLLKVWALDLVKIQKNMQMENSRILNTIYTFANGDETPSISQGHVFKTANTTPVTINDFDDAKTGERITILAKDTNTTIRHHTSFVILKNGTNKSLLNNETIEFVNIEGIWYEV